MNNIKIGNSTFEYIIEYKNIKNIYFRVKDDLIIHVSANKRVSRKYIEELLIQNEDIILKMFDKQLKNKEYDNHILYLGNELSLILYDGKPYIKNDYIYARSFDDAKKYINSLCYDVFSKRLELLKLQYEDLPVFSLKVRKMTSKWGVCNKRSMTVTLNSELIKKDVHLIDYVIIHELCHFKYMDHSSNFWSYVEKFYPYYKLARKELNY